MLEVNQVYNMDCIEGLKKLEDNSIDLVIIDPPYSSGTRQATNRKAGAIPKRGEKWAKAGIIWDSSFSSFGLSQFMNTFYTLVKEKMKEHCHIYTFIDWRHYPLISLSLEQAGLFINNLIVWDKGMYTLGGNYRSQYELIIFASKGQAKRLNTTTQGNVFKYKRVHNGEHPTEKPEDLLSDLIKFASNEGELVLDCFCGSGSTLNSAKRMRRDFVGFDIRKEYVNIANQRLQQTPLISSWSNVKTKEDEKDER